MFLDRWKAFDTVNHDMLLEKMHQYGIRGQNLVWCKTYLENRKQRTLANSVLSQSNLITCGVPQGSALGPLFFIMYVNDMQCATRGANVQFYAEDNCYSCV